MGQDVRKCWENRKRAAGLVQAGYSLGAAAKETGLAYTTVQKALREFGISSQPMNVDRLAKMAFELLRTADTIVKICERLRIEPSTGWRLYKALIKAGFEDVKRKRGRPRKEDE